jgi:hypothetical protein
MSNSIKTFIYKQLLKENVNKDNMPCNQPMKSNRPEKKRMVKVCDGERQQIIHYGATGYGHNYSEVARKSFRARHKCDQQTDKFTAAYWACKDLWAGPKGDTLASPTTRKGKY